MKPVLATVLAVLAVASTGAATAQTGQPAQMKVGALTCNVDSGWGFVFGSSKGLRCTFSGPGGKVENYTGEIRKFGVDIGYAANGVIVWGVLTSSTTLDPGALAGDYAGATGSAAVGVGIGANVLVGGQKDSISLQPLSVEGMTGLNVAGGIAVLNLVAAK